MTNELLATADALDAQAATLKVQASALRAIAREQERQRAEETKRNAREAAMALERQDVNAPRFLLVREVCKRIRVSRMTLYRMSRSGRFPKPLKLSDNRHGWPVDAVVNWETSQKPVL